MSPARIATLPGAYYAQILGHGTSRGVASMLIGMAAFVSNDALIKLASVTTPTGQLVTIRNLIATAVILSLIHLTGQAAHLRRSINAVVLARSGFDILATLLYLLALFHMPIGNVTAINMATPLAMTAAAAVFLRAPVGWRRWTAVIVGFIGVMLIVQPRAEGFNAYALLAVGSVIFIVARDLTTRNIDQSIPSLVITLTNAVMVMLGALVMVAFEGWADIGLREYLLIVCAAFFLIAGYLLIVDAFRHGDLATVSPFRYTALIWALLFGFLIWGDLPNLLAQVGIVIVVASGLYVLHRERVRARDEAAKSAVSE
jgi:drug/metabolite transporter (DMT)-like permease